MRKPKFVLTIDGDSFDLIICSLIEMKNRLTRASSDEDAYLFVINLLKDKGVTELSSILTEMCREREEAGRDMDTADTVA